MTTPPGQHLIDRLDRFGQRHRTVALFVAALHRYRDDGGRYVAASVALYGLMSLFPLLLLLVSALGYALDNDRTLQNRLLQTAFGQFPVINEQLRSSIRPLTGSGVGLAVGVLALAWGSVGVVRALEHAMEVVWGPPVGRRGTPASRAGRGVLLLGLLGAGLVMTAGLSAVVAAAHRPLILVLIGLVLSIAISVGVFAGVFRVMAPRQLAWDDVLPGAAIAGVGWVGLELAGGLIVGRYLNKASQLYGVFGTTLALVVFLLLVSQLSVLAVEVNAVRAAGRPPVGLRRAPPDEPV